MTLMFGRKDLEEVKEFIESGAFVEFMNEEGLSFNAMAWILNTLILEAEKIDKELD